MLEIIAFLLTAILTVILGVTPTVFSSTNPAGMNGVVSSNSGTHGTPVWANCDIVKDVKLGDSTELWKASLRRMVPFNVYISTMRDLNPTFKIAYIPTDVFFIALLAAYQNGTGLDLVFTDGPVATVGNQGPRADWAVAKFEITQNLAEGDEVDVELKPLLTANKPTWYVAV